MPEIIRAENIKKKFKDFTALKGVSFSINRGEVFGLIGPNGAGKSTLLKLMTFLDFPSSGRIHYLFGEGFHSGQKIRQFFGLVPQEEAFYRGFSVEENLAFFGSLYGLTGKELKDRTDFLLDWLKLKKFRKKKAENLSGGYRRLLNIAVSLVHDPEIIFLDEPTVGLDPKMRSTFWEKILELKARGKTICLTTHYMDEAEELCDRVALLFGGQILLEGKPAVLVKDITGEELLDFWVERAVPVRAVQLLQELLTDSVVEAKGKKISIFLSGKDSLFKEAKVRALFKEIPINVSKYERKKPGLEDVFIKLVERRGEAFEKDLEYRLKRA